MAQSKNSKKKTTLSTGAGKAVCTFCGGPREGKKVTLTYARGAGWVMIESVPASVCRLCGEKFFTPAVSERILRILGQAPAGARTVTVPVIDFDAA